MDDENNESEIEDDENLSKVVDESSDNEGDEEEIVSVVDGSSNDEEDEEEIVSGDKENERLVRYFFIISEKISGQTH